MTDSVKEISGSQGVSAGGSYRGGSFSGEHKKSGGHSPQGDVVEISKDARELSTGGKKKSLLKYLKELFG